LAYSQSLFPIGSQLDRMVTAFLNNNVTQLLYAIAVVEPVAGVVATQTVTFTGAPTASGTLTFYIAGQQVPIQVLSTDTPTIMATNLAAAVTAMPSLPVTATNAVGVVTLTTKWKGDTGNDIQVQLNYGGAPAGQFAVPGVTVAIAAGTLGTGQPIFTPTITAVAAGNYVNVAIAQTDTSSLSTWGTEYGFGPTGRWSYIRQAYGWIYSAHRSTNFNNAITFGQLNNQPCISIMEIEQNTPSPIWEVAAAYCGRGASALLDDPARPLQTLELIGVVPAASQDQYTDVIRNNLTGNGLAIQRVAPGGNMMILREQTTYQKNQYGQTDTAFGLLTILATLKAVISRQRAAITSKFPRYKLAPDGTRFGPGQAIVTPTIIKGELIAEARQDEYDGLVADVAIFKNNLLVEIDTTNPNRINVLFPPRLIGQLRIFAVLAQFRLLFPQDSGIQP
jgi:phage tail sheath gpL-like